MLLRPIHILVHVWRQLGGYWSTDIYSTSTSSTEYDEPKARSGVSGPPLPAEGLPDGWSMDQWTYYGEAYLNGDFDE